MFSRLIFIFIFILTIPYSLYPIPAAYAFTMENQNIRLELPDVLGEQIQTQPQQQSPEEEVKPRIIAGFPKIKTTKPFSFTVSSLLLDLGIITPTDPVIRTTSLILGQGAARNGYTVLAFEDHPLRETTTKDEIRDTTCDTGTCSEIQAASWANPLVFGAGLRIDNIQGKISNLMYSNSEILFSQIADQESSEAANAIIVKVPEKEEDRNDEARITYKVNVSASQKEGIYQNVISLIAVPNF